MVQYYKSAPIGKSRGIFRSWGAPEEMDPNDIIESITIPPCFPRRSNGDVIVFKDLPSDRKIR